MVAPLDGMLATLVVSYSWEALFYEDEVSSSVKPHCCRFDAATIRNIACSNPIRYSRIVRQLRLYSLRVSSVTHQRGDHAGSSRRHRHSRLWRGHLHCHLGGQHHCLGQVSQRAPYNEADRPHPETGMDQWGLAICPGGHLD